MFVHPITDVILLTVYVYISFLNDFL